uniref:Uncharacterized protein n=1 Tax=Triticum urartu TaxID=4572 RepID=A0A8R7UDB4_TRIUA
MAPNASDKPASSCCGTSQKHDIDEPTFRRRCSTAAETTIVATDNANPTPIRWSRVMPPSRFVKRRSAGTTNRS